MSISRPHWLPPRAGERNLFRCWYELGRYAPLVSGLLFVAAAAGCSGPGWFASASSTVLPLPDPTTPAAAAATPSSVPPGVAATTAAPGAATAPGDHTAAARPLEQLQHTDPQQLAAMREILDQTAGSLPPPYQEHLAAQLLAVAGDRQRRQAEANTPPPDRPRAAEFRPLVTAAPHTVAAPPAPQRTAAIAAAAPAATSAAVAARDATADTGDESATVGAGPGPVAASVADSAADPGVVAAARTPAAADPAPPDAADEFSAGEWLTAIEEALTQLQQELARGDHDPADAARLQACRRLLHAVANDRQQALTAIDEMDDDEQAFWKHLLFGLLVSLDADQQHVSSRRAALALRDLRRATDHLANISTLDVRNLALCREVESYGRYSEFKSASFRPGQEVLLYVEVENFAAEAVAAQYETELQGEYQVFDAEGRRVAHVVLPLDKQRSNNRRRDYFIAYPAFLPQKIAPGAYTLQLTIEDVKGHKSNQASIDFRIR